MSSSRTRRTAARAGVKARSGDPAHSKTLTSTRSARSPSRSRSRDARSSRVSPNLGVTCSPRYGYASERRSAPRRSVAAPAHRPPTPQARPPSAAEDRRQPTAKDRAAVPADRSGQHAPAGDDDAYRSRPRCPCPPTHQRAQPSHWPPTEPNRRTPEGEGPQPAVHHLSAPYLEPRLRQRPVTPRARGPDPHQACDEPHRWATTTPT